MSKQRAFVRYTKSGRVVPGSLILTNGSYPAGPALWQEVIVDMCCKPCDCRTIKEVNNETGWSLTDCDGRVWGCNPGPEICETPKCIDISKPYRGVTIGPASCECQCIALKPPVNCNCYLIVNPSFTDILDYSFIQCGGGKPIGGFLGPGQFNVVCANTDSVELSVGLLMEAIADCSPEIVCLTPPTPCVTYYISNNTGGFITIGYTGCGGGESGFINLPPGANTAICATLGSVDAPGATINLAVIGCAG